MNDEDIRDARLKALFLAINEYYGMSLKYMSRSMSYDSDGTSSANCIADEAIADYAIACG